MDKETSSSEGGGSGQTSSRNSGSVGTSSVTIHQQSPRQHPTAQSSVAVAASNSCTQDQDSFYRPGYNPHQSFTSQNYPNYPYPSGGFLYPPHPIHYTSQIQPMPMRLVPTANPDVVILLREIIQSPICALQPQPSSFLGLGCDTGLPFRYQPDNWYQNHNRGPFYGSGYPASAASASSQIEPSSNRVNFQTQQVIPYGGDPAAVETSRPRTPAAVETSRPRTPAAVETSRPRTPATDRTSAERSPRSLEKDTDLIDVETVTESHSCSRPIASVPAHALLNSTQSSEQPCTSRDALALTSQSSVPTSSSRTSESSNDTTSFDFDAFIAAMSHDPSRIVQALDPILRGIVRAMIMEPPTSDRPNTTTPSNVAVVTASRTSALEIPESQITVGNPIPTPTPDTLNVENVPNDVTCEIGRIIHFLRESYPPERVWIANEILLYHSDRYLNGEPESSQEILLEIIQDLNIASRQNMDIIMCLYRSLVDEPNSQSITDYFKNFPTEFANVFVRNSDPTSTINQPAKEKRLLDAILVPQNLDPKSQSRYVFAKKVNEYLKVNTAKAFEFRNAFVTYSLNINRQLEDIVEGFQIQNTPYTTLKNLIDENFRSLLPEFFNLFEMPKVPEKPRKNRKSKAAKRSVDTSDQLKPRSANKRKSKVDDKDEPKRKSKVEDKDKPIRKAKVEDKKVKSKRKSKVEDE